MKYEEAKMQIQAIPEKIWDQLSEPDREAMEMAFSALQEQDVPDTNVGDMISRQAEIEAVKEAVISAEWEYAEEALEKLPSAQPENNKYEYHYDHTDCIWYRPEARNRCPTTCAQYRDGWNDAMNYIFRDGKGYRPYKRSGYGE